MLASISPLGERARHNRWWVTAAYYTAASGLAGAGVGAGAAGLGDLIGAPGPWRSATTRALVVGACLVAAAIDARGWVLPPHRQVDEGWLDRYRRWVYAWGFGAQLGAGVLTVVTSGAVPLVLVLCFLSGRVVPGVVVGAVYGLVRALPVLALALVRRPAQLRRFHQRMAAAAPAARWATVAALVGAAALSAVT